MTDVNNKNIDLAVWYQYRDHSSCCCSPHYDALPCVKCRPVMQICCLFATFERYPGIPFVFTRQEGDLVPWVPGDACDDRGSTNLCGVLSLYWGPDPSPCLPDLILTWIVDEDCKHVQIRFVDPLGFATSGWTTIERDWYLTPLVLPDPWYMYLNSQDPDTFPLPAPTVTIENCPVPTPVFDSGAEDIMLKGWLQVKVGGIWQTHEAGRIARGLGNCIGGAGYFCLGIDNASFHSEISWCLNLETGEVVVEVQGDNGYASGTAIKSIPYADCAWADTPFTIPIVSEISGVTDYRWWIKRVTDCSDDGGGPPDPCDPGCWPPCVACPEQKSLYAVVEQDPSCCLHGSYGLSYDTENNWYTLPSPVGGPEGFCGEITALKVTCASESSVTVEVSYHDINSNDHTVTDTLTGSCDEDGNFETSALSIPSGLLVPGLCEGGVDKGARIRIVSL